MSDSGLNIPVVVMANDFAMRRNKQIAQQNQAAAGQLRQQGAKATQQPAISTPAQRPLKK
jgi:hypothetical protein